MGHGLIVTAAAIAGTLLMLFTLALSSDEFRTGLKIEWLALWAGVQSVTWTRRDGHDARHRVVPGGKSYGRGLA